MSEKSDRLFAESDTRVDCLGPAITFKVDGRYDTTIGDGFASCTCPARVRCYHIDACAQLVKQAAEDMAAVA